MIQYLGAESLMGKGVLSNSLGAKAGVRLEANMQKVHCFVCNPLKHHGLYNKPLNYNLVYSQ